MTFRLVRAAPSDSMIEAGLIAADGDHSDSVYDIPENAFRAMLAASEPPTNDEIDELCRKMWPTWYWEEQAVIGLRYQKLRNEDRTRMRAFLATIANEATEKESGR